MAHAAGTPSTLRLIHTVDCERTSTRGQLRLATVNGDSIDNDASTGVVCGANGAAAATPRRSLLSRVGQLIMPKRVAAPDVIVDADFWDHRHRS